LLFATTYVTLALTMPGPLHHIVTTARGTDTIQNYAKPINQPTPCMPNNMPHETTSAPSQPTMPGALVFTHLSSIPPMVQPTKQITHYAQFEFDTSLISTK
jgi:hypothetical protein